MVAHVTKRGTAQVQCPRCKRWFSKNWISSHCKQNHGMTYRQAKATPAKSAAATYLERQKALERQQKAIEVSSREIVKPAPAPKAPKGWKQLTDYAVLEDPRGHLWLAERIPSR